MTTQAKPTGPSIIHRIYDMHHGAICIVSRKGVEYLDWLHAFSAGRLGYPEAAW